VFESIDQPALKPWQRNASRSQWRQARVNIDYHASSDERLYGVPHALSMALRIRVIPARSAADSQNSAPDLARAAWPRLQGAPRQI